MKMIAPTAKNLKAIADHKYELNNAMKKNILGQMLASAENGCYSFTMSFSDREQCLIPKIKSVAKFADRIERLVRKSWL